MTENGIAMLKTSWLGNKNLQAGRKKGLSELSEEVIPSISLATQAIVLNKFWFRSVIHRLGVLDVSNFDLPYQLPLYSMYTVASAFFTKEYWLFLWEGKQKKVDELLQLKKAWQWYRDRDGKYAKTRLEATKTSFISSSTNSFSDIHFDMFHFNHVINSFWLDGQFDSMENFPKDFSDEYIRSWLKKAGNVLASCEGWEAWSNRFKKQYADFGCEVE